MLIAVWRSTFSGESMGPTAAALAASMAVTAPAASAMVSSLSCNCHS